MSANAPIDRPLVDAGPSPIGKHAKAWIPLVGCGFMVFCFAVIAVPAFLKTISRPGTHEGTMHLRKIFDASVTYFATHQRFPESETLTPAAPSGEYPRVTETWSDSATWSALRFRIDDRHFFAYQYDSSNDPTDPNRSTFTASAFGDLDGDGLYSTFVRFGSVDAMEVTGSGGLYIVSELE